MSKGKGKEIQTFRQATNTPIPYDADKIRNRIIEIEDVMRDAGCDTVKLNEGLTHHFADGLYARELFMEAGQIVISKIHKYNHFTFIMKGKAEVVDEFQAGTIVEAPYFMTTPRGMKRILHILEDSIWITVHSTDIQDVDEVEDAITLADHSTLLEHLDKE